ncbi:MAG TPA: GWxTD domain-containing protein [candidate division WOR-3 bacterium]|uniref:GWxTD domain-containing protein n=1 Tax=candidate division WOR-3 bacterium TaxID=2052148 RepID=A0A9C9JZW5_UNCW3|nr:GWxTD domain-containing protein [candidate division WOR-3 bacterium]
MRNKRRIFSVILLLFFLSCGVANIFAARYYRLLEKERKIFLGLRALDAVAAVEYINLASATERAAFYENFWKNKSVQERKEFEERIEYAFKEFGRFAPLSDDRILVYVKYGSPSKREQILPQKKPVKTKEIIKPAEIWTYKKEGLIFDFVRLTRAYKTIAQSRFGKQANVPYLEEVNTDTVIEVRTPGGLLKLDVATGRFRQEKNLTRLELYITVELEDTAGLLLSRNVKIFSKKDSLVAEKHHILIPKNSEQGIFFDEVNFWLMPEEYRIEFEIIDGKNNRIGKKTLWVNLLDYQNDAKEISDLIPARLIDREFTHKKFHKPVGRVIPLTKTTVPVHQPFYFYAEVYNLETQGGMHRLKMTYEVYNKEKMRREVIDVMMKDQSEVGDVAYLASQYHPMDLAPGHYLIVLKVKDLFSEKERTAVAEFELSPLK